MNVVMVVVVARCVIIILWSSLLRPEHQPHLLRSHSPQQPRLHTVDSVPLIVHPWLAIGFELVACHAKGHVDQISIPC